MEKELLETFEAAKKAAEAAADGGGAPEVERCLDALKRLRKIPVTMKDLVDTQVGKRLRNLTKHPHEKIQAVASDLLKFWKNVVIEETTKDTKKSNTPQDKTPMKLEVKSGEAGTIKVEKVPKSGPVKVDMVSRSESLKVEKINGMKVETVLKSETLKVEKREPVQVNGNQTMKVDKIIKEEKEVSATKKQSFVPISSPKLTSMVKCNNPVRDKLRDLLAEAFVRVSKETSESDREEVRNIWDEVDACDPIRVAVTVESAMFERLGPSTGEHKVKYRSIMFNLKDSKNPDFRRRVLLGDVAPEKLVDLTPEEMASDERKLSNKQIKEKALFECERGGPEKATTDQFRCGRCGQRKCTYYQLQTRSADEPMTTFVTCVNCNNHWKFC